MAGAGKSCSHLGRAGAADTPPPPPCLRTSLTMWMHMYALSVLSLWLPGALIAEWDRVGQCREVCG